LHALAAVTATAAHRNVCVTVEWTIVVEMLDGRAVAPRRVLQFDTAVNTIFVSRPDPSFIVIRDTVDVRHIV
jgi:hypothetical protein